MNQLNDISNNININNNNNKWFLMLCELQFPHIHGQSSETHYLVYDRFHGPTGISFQDLDNVNFDYETDEEYESDDDIDDGIMTIYKSMTFLKEHYRRNHYNYPDHPCIRNYRNIITRENYIRPEIGQYIILPSLEAVAILKTVWLRIIQRTWKNVFKKRQYIIKHRSNPNALYWREITGKWKPEINHIPGLKGMLNKLKHHI